MATSKLCVFLLIFILKCLSKSNLIRTLMIGKNKPKQILLDNDDCDLSFFITFETGPGLILFSKFERGKTTPIHFNDEITKL